ncbi:MAG TPA: HAMP domain-containing sensor histidine kinase, partial [Actinomycetota bacterium]|nr:HAMP domain-containing sensor histidine kinase [Actinomycetota bacterium]
DPDAARSLVSVVGVGQPAKLRLEDVLGSVRPAGAVVTSTERAQVIGPVVATVGRSTRITVGAGDRCVVVVAASGPLLGRRVEMITALVDDTLPLVASSARRGLEASGLDRGLAWTAHELRTPILGVKAAIESVANRSDPPAEELLRLSVEELDKLASDAEGILGWASGRRGLDRQMVDVSALVAEAVTGTWLGQRNEARIAIDAPRPATAFVDPTQLRVAVTNLLRNALAYAESGSVAISVRGDEGAVRVSVRDGGPGVRPADRDGIFEPFARGGAGGHPTGSGLGLFITRQIAEAHGGRAWVDSDGPGHGATFHIQVPTDGRVLQRPAS